MHIYLFFQHFFHYIITDIKNDLERPERPRDRKPSEPPAPPSYRDIRYET
jgi:hypothetical protein